MGNTRKPPIRFAPKGMGSRADGLSAVEAYLRDDLAIAAFGAFLVPPVLADAALFAGVADFAGFDGPADRAALFAARVFIVRIEVW